MVLQVPCGSVTGVYYCYVGIEFKYYQLKKTKHI